MHLVSYVDILVVRQRFEGLEGNIGAAGGDPGELRRGHDPCARYFEWSCGAAVGIAGEPSDQRRTGMKSTVDSMSLPVTETFPLRTRTVVAECVDSSACPPSM